MNEKNRSDRMWTVKRGVRMAVQVAAVGAGVAATTLAMAAEGEQTKTEEANHANAAESGEQATGQTTAESAAGAMKVNGLLGASGCNISRGPAAPPEVSDAAAFAALLLEVPS